MGAGAGTLSGVAVSAAGGTSAARDGSTGGRCNGFGGRRLISGQVGIHRSRRGNAARRGRPCVGGASAAGDSSTGGGVAGSAADS